MGYKEFLPWGNKSVTIEFNCDECGQHVVSREIGIPSPNYTAERSSDSHNVDEGYVVCDGCEKEFNFSVSSGYSDAYVLVDYIEDDEIGVNEIVDERELDYFIEGQIDAIIGSLNFITAFSKEISNLKQLNDVTFDNVVLQETLQRQIYSGAITCLEDYLSTTLIQEVLNKEEYFKNFVKTYHGIRNRKFELSEIYDKLDKLTDIVKIELVAIIYHDLPKVKEMYQETLKIEFPAISELMTIIKTRHDMVHRNGKNKEGEKIELTKELVFDMIRKVEEFVNCINDKLTNR
ncbi:MAG: hypothetical protein H7239_12700 [Flavobacterium sp.]|nr:hypothetical protein [Flavobacterium sp.]